MEIHINRTDDPRRVWQPGEEPAACAARPRNDAGGSRGTQRRPRHRGQPHRERQARPPSLDGPAPGRGRRSQRKRSAALSIRPASGRSSATGDRPIAQRAYFIFNVWRSGTTGLTGAIFILAHPLPCCLLGASPHARDPQVSTVQRLAEAVGLCAIDLLLWASGQPPFSCQRLEADPFVAAYLDFNVCRSGATGLMGAIFIPCSPLSVCQPGRLPGRERPVPSLSTARGSWPFRECSVLLEDKQQGYNLANRLDLHSNHLLAYGPSQRRVQYWGGTRFSRQGGQPHREPQARPPSLDGPAPGRGRRPLRKRSAPLSSRPASGRSSATGDRPIAQRAYFVLYTCRSGTTGLTGAIFILAHPLPLVSARRFAGAGEGDGKEVLSAGCLLSAQNAHEQRKPICSGILEKT